MTSTDTSGLPVEDSPEPNSDAASEDLVPESNDLVLIEAAEDGTFLVFGDGDIPELDVRPLWLMSPKEEHALGKAVATMTGATNVAAQALNAINQVRGLVRLAPDTLGTMRAGAAPLVKDG